VTLLSIIIPTIPGREDHYERCLNAYRDRTSTPNEIITEYDHSTCGKAWQAGADKAKGDYIHLTCDDLEPMDGWDLAAIELTDRGFLPAPRVLNVHLGILQSRPYASSEFPDGIDTGITVIPFCSRQQWEKISPLLLSHYYSDDFFSDRGRQAGFPPKMCNKYSFNHHWAMHKRGAGMGSEEARTNYDRALYYEALRKVTRGEWTEPWPS